MNFDKYQKEIITTNDNILVIAGPGSGKTTTILGKVNYLLQNNIPSDILLLSFTNKSVNDIKQRLNEDIFVATFHKLAIDILKTYNYEFKIVNDNLLPYIIDEYLITLDNMQKKKLCNYLNITNLKINSNEYLSFKKLIITFINLFKTNNYNINKLKQIVNNYHDKLLINIILDIFKIYEEEKQSTNSLDFDDLIINATNILHNNYKYRKFKYIIVDEFQDTSLIRLNLIKEIYQSSNAIITAVGDDAQSIFHFSGCDLNIFLNFQNYFPNSRLVFLKNTYRNSQKLINISSAFIEKNPLQIKKNMHSMINDNNPIDIIYYYNSKKVLKDLLNKLIKNNENNIMILGRNKKDIYNYIDNSFSLNDNMLTYNNCNFKYLTIHSSKGLESKIVIIIGLENKIYGLPNKLENHSILNYLNQNVDNIIYAEERRVFFVAITRCKEKTYLLVPKQNPSIFIKEIKKLL